MIETDALIVGAGPAGLFQVFQLGLHQVQSHVVDVLPYAGGQCVELYADKPIYDIPGIPRCTGRQLIDNLLTQARPFKPVFHLGQLVSQVERQPDGRLHVVLSGGAQFLTKTLFIAAGVGAFLPRSVKMEGVEALAAGQIAFHLDLTRSWNDRHVVVLGDTDAALQSVVQLSALPSHQRPASVTLVHRREVFQAEATTLRSFQEAVAHKHARFIAAQPSAVVHDNGQLQALRMLGSDAQHRDIAATDVLVQMGLSPKLGPIADWGLALDRRQLSVNTETFETSERGIYAVGDINTYPGKKKLIACAFHECVLAAFGALSLIYPDQRILLQYTTTSTRLHELLGVGPST